MRNEVEALERVPEFEDLLSDEIDLLHDENIYQNVLNLSGNNPTDQRKKLAFNEDNSLYQCISKRTKK